jgi:hypothetical protein
MLFVLFDTFYDSNQIPPEMNLPLNFILTQCSGMSGA